MHKKLIALSVAGTFPCPDGPRVETVLAMLYLSDMDYQDKMGVF